MTVAIWAVMELGMNSNKQNSRNIYGAFENIQFSYHFPDNSQIVLRNHWKYILFIDFFAHW